MVGVGLGRHDAVLGQVLVAELHDGDDGPSGLVADVDHLREQPLLLPQQIVTEQDRERFVADVVAGAADSVSEAQRLALADVVDQRELGDGLYCGQQAFLACRGELALELDGLVEVVLQRTLPTSGDHEDVVEPGANRFLDDVLDRRLVHQREHLLGLGLRGRQEPRTEARGGNDGLACAHCW